MTSPVVKFESSPADSLVDSFVSTPGTQYDSLFPESTIDPSEAIMTPPFDADSSRAGSVIEESPGPEKKPAKKRKSWGQQLPEPKTNLPPRKRAKTEDEKEQRRVERVLRNRRAAQSSRERKRLEVEALENEKKAIERRNKDLELRLADMEARNMLLQQQLAQITGNMTVFNQPSPPQVKPEPYLRAPSPVTLSQELFSSRDSKPTTSFVEQTPAEPSLTLRSSIQTVNPASLSPEIRPVAESSLSNASSSDMTQHPAAMLCDLQCQSDEDRPWILTSPLPASQASPNQQASETISAMMLCLTMLSAATSTILSPLWQIINSLRTASSLSPTPSLLNSIIWLTTTPSSLSSTTSTSTTSSTPTTTSTPRSFFTLRLTLLRRLLACSPQLARPLMDATMAVLRSASDRASGLGFEGEVSACGCESADGVDRDRCKSCLGRKNHEPSIEALMTLLWATYVIDREHRQKQRREDTENLNLFPPQTFAGIQEERGWRHKMEEKSIIASSASSSSCRRSWASTASRRSGRGRRRQQHHYHQQPRWE